MIFVSQVNVWAAVQGVIQRNKLTPRLLKVFTATEFDSIDSAVKVSSAHALQICVLLVETEAC
jgi:hypothetical protein